MSDDQTERPEKQSKLPQDLSEYQRKVFAAAFLVHLNTAEAAREAGLHTQTGRNLLKHDPDVRQMVMQGFKERQMMFDMTVDDVVDRLSRIALANVADYLRLDKDGQVRIDMTKASRDQLYGVTEISQDVIGMEETGGFNEDGDAILAPVIRTKVKVATPGEKINALEKLGKHLGMFKGELLDPVGDGPSGIIQGEARDKRKDKLNQMVGRYLPDKTQAEEARATAVDVDETDEQEE